MSTVNPRHRTKALPKVKQGTHVAEKNVHQSPLGNVSTVNPRHRTKALPKVNKYSRSKDRPKTYTTQSSLTFSQVSTVAKSNATQTKYNYRSTFDKFRLKRWSSVFEFCTYTCWRHSIRKAEVPRSERCCACAQLACKHTLLHFNRPYL